MVLVLPVDHAFRADALAVALEAVVHELLFGVLGAVTTALGVGAGAEWDFEHRLFGSAELAVAFVLVL